MPTVLVVDDIPENVQLLKFALEDDGYSVITASNGHECLDRLAAREPDLILLDIMMPGMDGMETLQHIKKQPQYKHIAVIMVSANDDEERVITALDQGAHDFVPKPINYHILAARMRSALRLRDTQRQLTQLNKDLARLASTDSLTGVYNRRYYFERAEVEFTKAQRHGRPLSIIMLDVDRFKSVNDDYGHNMGDLALVELTRVCNHLIRSSDFVGRLGGEEFAICCPETDLDGATRMAERIRHAVSQNRVKSQDLEISLTVSIGIAELAAGDDRIDRLQERADQLLYKAKQQGRNRVVAVANNA